MLRMEIVGPDSAVTARRQIINFSLDAKRIPLSVCSPPPSTRICLPFFASVVSSIGLSLSRCLFDFAKWKNFSRMQERRSWQPVELASSPPPPFYSNFFPPAPRSRIFSQRPPGPRLHTPSPPSSSSNTNNSTRFALVSFYLVNRSTKISPLYFSPCASRLSNT